MTKLLACLLVLPALLEAAAPPRGQVYHYRPGLFAEVAANRAMTLAWGQVDGFASVTDCQWVDVARPWVVRARIAGGPVQRFQIVDCSDPRDLPAQRRKRLVLEVDWQTAYAAGFAYPPCDGHAPAVILGYERLR